jgi:transposase
MQMALGLTPPWTVVGSDFDETAHRLDIHIDFPAGSRFACPSCGGNDCPAYDTDQMTWRHLNFFQHEAYLNARVPRIRCDKCGIRKVQVPWARPDSGFTLLFEAMVMQMISAMPVKAVARMVGEHDTRLWRVLHHYVDQARARMAVSEVKKLAIDETAARRGHDYVTLFVDIDRARVLFATEGKDAATVAAFADDFAAHGGDPKAISEVCIDMSPAFISGVADKLPNAAVTFDKFHAVKIINDAVDEVRRSEQRKTLSYGARATSGCAIRKTCRTGKKQRCKRCQHNISKPPALTKFASRSRTSMISLQLSKRRPTSRNGTSGPLIAGLNQ